MMNRHKITLLIGILILSLAGGCFAEEDDAPTADEDIGKSRDASKTDDETVAREEEAIKLDGLSVAQMKELRDKAEKHAFQAEVSRMMKLIINSLYKNKEIFLRELISNASDALDKIRLLSLTDKSALDSTAEMSIKIRADKENHQLHITDTGIGMTKDELMKNLGTIAKSGTSEFFAKIADSTSSEAQDLIGQFGVGFYSSFLVADRVVVTSKNNEDPVQHIWESDSSQFSVADDPRGDTLKRGTTITLHLKEEAYDFLEPDTIKDLVKKYSQFINFPIYLWTSKTEEVEEPLDEEEQAEKDKEEAEKEKEEEEDEEGKVEEEAEEEDKPKTKKVEKTVWDWELMNETKPIWMRKPSEIEESEYNEFYKSFTKDHDDPLARIHFTAEGEVTFKSVLFIPKRAPSELLQSYGKKTDSIKMYVRRVFITSDFEEMMPKYLSFVKGMVDSDDLPLNVSRETLQQHKLLKVIKKKLARKTLDMIKKMDDDTFKDFWKEYSTFLKLGVIEDASNRTRISKLLRFYSSNSESDQTSLSEYLERMKEKQESIYFMAGGGRQEVERSPFVERLLKKGYEVLYLTEAVDEYCIQSLPEFDGKKFQNVAKDGVNLDGDSERAKERLEAMEEEFKPLLDWLKDDVLSDKIEKAQISQRLTNSPCALVASQYGWSGNMEKLVKSQAYAKSGDPTQDFYANQKKILEMNPRHPVVKELLRRVEKDKDDGEARRLALMLYDTATLRSGYQLKDTAAFADRIDSLLRNTMDISLDEKVEEEEELAEEEEEGEEEAGEGGEDEEGEEADEDVADKDEL